MSVTEQLDVTPTPASTVEDGVFYDKEHGKVMLRIGGEVWWLRRPTFGEFRRASENVEAMKSPPAKKQAGGDPVLTMYASETVLKTRIEFWKAIVLSLSDRPLPADDDLPYWLAGADLINDTMGHWLSVPPAAPGA